MESFDDILAGLRPALAKEPNLVEPVLAQLKVRRERRMRWLERVLAGGLGLALGGLILSLIFGNGGKVIWLGLSKAQLVSQHKELYWRALVEALSLRMLIIFGLLVIASLLLSKYKDQLARHARTAGAAIGVAALLTLSTTAAAATAITQPPGAIQQELERTVNGLGNQEVTVDGQTYELAAGSNLTDRQIKAHAEQMAVWEIRKTLDLPADQVDGGTLAYDGFVDSYNQSQLVLSDVFPDTNTIKIGQQPFGPTRPKALKLSSQTVYLQGAKRVEKLDLKPGDYIEVSTAKDFVTAAYIVKWSYLPQEYDWTSAITSNISQHRSDGKCYNNETDSCPNLPAVSDVAGADYDLPADAVIREVFGQLVSNDGEVIKIKTSSGAIWSFNAGASIIALNQSGYYCPDCPGGADKSFQTNVGDYLRVEFWQHKSDLGKHEVYDQGFRGTKAEAQQLAAEGKLNTHPELYIRKVQVALMQPWYQGQVPVKYHP